MWLLQQDLPENYLIFLLLSGLSSALRCLVECTKRSIYHVITMCLSCGVMFRPTVLHSGIIYSKLFRSIAENSFNTEKTAEENARFHFIGRIFVINVGGILISRYVIGKGGSIFMAAFRHKFQPLIKKFILTGVHRDTDFSPLNITGAFANLLATFHNRPE